MSNSLMYSIGKWVGANRVISAALVALLGYGIFADSRKPPAAAPTPQPVAASAPAAASTPPPDPRIEACGPQLDARRAQAKAAAGKKDYAEAYRLMDYCATRMAADTSGAKELKTYAVAHAKAIDAAVAAKEKAEKARKKKEGVRIGMREQDVLDSSWGRPEKINRSTNAYGTREQWVYGGGNYLYFKDGVLTSIQN
jgi:hypothetical protein